LQETNRILSKSKDMALPKELKQWNAEVSSQLAHLSKNQAWVLSLYSWGMVLTKHCGITTIVTLLSMILAVSPSNLRQQLREWCYEAEQKRGQKRCAIAVQMSFAPLLRWILKDGDKTANWFWRWMSPIGGIVLRS
jgi:hypothetical protein